MVESVEKQIGTARKRVEDPRLLRGEGAYVDDLREAGCLHAAFVRSPYPHARILGIDAAAARAVPGVIGVFTSEDITSRMPPAMRAVPEVLGDAARPLASDTVRFCARGRFRSAMSGLRTCDHAHGRVVPLVPLAGEPPVRAAQPTAPAVGNAGS